MRKASTLFWGRMFSASIVAPMHVWRQEHKEHRKKCKFQTPIALDGDRSGYRFGIHGIGGLCTQFNYNLISYNNFQQQYNAKNASQQKTPLGDLKLKGGTFCGIGLHGTSAEHISFYIDVIAGQQEGAASATLKNGDRRELRLVQRPVITNMDLVMYLSKRFSLGMALGVEQAIGKHYGLAWQATVGR